MKKALLLIFITLTASVCVAQNKTQKHNFLDQDGSAFFTAFEDEPQFPGGLPRFFQHVQSKIEMPEVVKLLGFAPEVVVSIFLNREGKQVAATKATDSGTGLEEAIIQATSQLPPWKPGSQAWRCVKSKLTFPFSIKPNAYTVVMNKLNQSNYNFVFSIKDRLYNIEDAEKQLGAQFASSCIENVLPYADDNYIKDERKKKSFFVVIKP